MQTQKLTNYAAYIKEKANAELIEFENGWISFIIEGSVCHICDIWVHKDHRRSKLGHQLVMAMVEIAKPQGCKWITSSCIINSNGFNQALIAQLNYGFVVTSATSEKINLVKEI